MATSDLNKLKFNLQETNYPYFSDDDLAILLEMYPDLNEASYQGCLLKATADDSIEISGIVLESNRGYWLTLADRFKKKMDGTYITSRGRADGC